jgi:hypothetical protein
MELKNCGEMPNSKKLILKVVLNLKYLESFYKKFEIQNNGG